MQIHISFIATSVWRDLLKNLMELSVESTEESLTDGQELLFLSTVDTVFSKAVGHPIQKQRAHIPIISFKLFLGDKYWQVHPKYWTLNCVICNTIPAMWWLCGLLGPLLCTQLYSIFNLLLMVLGEIPQGSNQLYHLNIFTTVILAIKVSLCKASSSSDITTNFSIISESFCTSHSTQAVLWATALCCSVLLHVASYWPNDYI